MFLINPLLGTGLMFHVNPDLGLIVLVNPLLGRGLMFHVNPLLGRVFT